MGHGTAGRNFEVAVSQHTSRTLAAADIRSTRAVDCTIITLRPTGTKLEYCTALCCAGDTVGLGRDQRLMVDCQKYHGFDKLGLNHRARDRYKRLAGEYRRALRNSPYIALELEMPQVVQKCFRKAAAAT